jgi:hypothetical protein
MATWVPDRGAHEGGMPLYARAGTLVQRILFYGYLLVVLAAFIYPMHYLSVDGTQVEVGRHILFMAPVVYRPDSVQIIREVMLVTVIFLPLVHLAIRYGPEHS